MLAATRLRVSYDLQYEVDNFNLLMDEAAQVSAIFFPFKRAKS